MSGHEFNGRGSAARDPATPRTSPFHWSTQVPTVEGWYFERHPDPSNSGWETTVMKVFAPAAGAELLGEGIVCGERHCVKLSDRWWKRSQFSYEPIAEPLGG